jgi:hypothetical protein
VEFPCNFDRNVAIGPWWVTAGHQNPGPRTDKERRAGPREAPVSTGPGGFVVAGRNGPKVLNFVEEALDEVAPTIRPVG